ncbi:MAG TPA: sugar phosphate isomerase/epimerase family protein [bacterium]|nr:sugar phosphate isomerase/epimerase family protein [bacterium]
MTIQLACSSQSYDDILEAGHMTLVDWLRFCAEELGLAGVELEDKHIGPPSDERIDALRAAAARYGVAIVNIALMNNFGVADDGRRRDEEARTREWMAAGQRLGSRFLRTFAGWPEGDRAARWEAMIASLRAVCREAERRKARLVMENHDHGGFVQTSQDVTAIVEQVGSPALGLLLDTGNYLDGLASIAATAARAWHVHAKFTRVDGGGREPGIDHDAVIALLRQAGYDGWISIEYEGPEPSRTAVPRALGYLSQAIRA